MTLILEALNVRVEYGTFVAVPSLTMRLSAGDLLGLIGPNGARQEACAESKPSAWHSCGDT